MLIALWIINALLALAFLAAGFFKVTKSPEALKAQGMTWIESFSPTAVKLIGAAEILGALGLLLPLATDIAPVLTPVAAIGLAITMVGAVVVHARRKEPFVPALVLLALTAASAALGFANLAN